MSARGGQPLYGPRPSPIVHHELVKGASDPDGSAPRGSFKHRNHAQVLSLGPAIRPERGEAGSVQSNDLTDELLDELRPKWAILSCQQESCQAQVLGS